MNNLDGKTVCVTFPDRRKPGYFLQTHFFCPVLEVKPWVLHRVRKFSTTESQLQLAILF